MTLEQSDLKYLKGIGPVRADILKKELDLNNWADMLYYFPFRYVDRSRYYKISQLSDDLPYVQIRGHFVNFAVEGEGRKKRLKAAFSDGNSIMEVIWFAKVDSIRESLNRSTEYVLFGKPNYFNGHYSLVHPEVEKYDPAAPPKGLEGVYPLSDSARKRGISQRLFPTAMRSLFASPLVANIPETLPQEILDRHGFMSLARALREMHFPTDAETLRAARQRMKFEELFYLQLHILRYARERSHAVPGYLFSRVGEKFNGFFFDVLPFPLTGAQKRVLKEIRADMATGRQMNRLLQGDVGSGKTMVAFMTMLLAVDNGMQAALMAPTEILATQHYESLRPWCDRLGLKIALLTGSTKKKDRRPIHKALQDGSLDILVGTHALLEDTVEFHRLGVAVIDEQHRFGVAQRARLWRKGSVAPHVLVMTATPIPRTLAMTVYGDLEVSVIDELPPGRKPIATSLRYDDNRMEINQMIGHELREGRQVYIVYPLIRENPKLELKSVEQGFERICGTFPQYKVSMVHGQLSPEKKDAEMQKFASGETRIMVATTVIEVGVNVPNASVMVIENAERFGLSQLHQLRGRVGRGADRSYCVLVTKRNIGGDTAKRLKIMTETTDGFLISEADMKFRGPGDIEGTQQSGLPMKLHVADLVNDSYLMGVAREAARGILDGNPSLYARTQEEDSLLEQKKSSPLPLSPASLSLLVSELRSRFSKEIDWSQIS